MQKTMNMKKFFTPSATVLGGAVRRAAMMLLLCVMTCASAWAETVTTYYVDENGTRHNNITATVLTSDLFNINTNVKWIGTEGQTTWYVVNSSFTINDKKIGFDGDVRLILADDQTLTVNGGAEEAFYTVSSSLTIYGQTKGNGTLSASSTGSYAFWCSFGNITICSGTVNASNSSNVYSAIDAGNITISGGTVNVSEACIAIYARKTLTISGGTVNVSGTGPYYTVGAYESVNISGGKITVSGSSGLHASIGSITLGLASNDDFIKCKSYQGKVMIADSQCLYDEAGNAYSGTLNDDEIAAIAEQKLTAVAPAVPTYKLTYDLAGGQLPSGQTNPASYTPGTATFTLVNPVRDGYEFAGWTGTGLNSPTQTVTITQGSTGNRSYTATWNEGSTYTVSFNANGGEGTMAAQTHTYDASLALTANTFTRTGYTFAGWATTADGDVTYTDGESVSNIASAQGANVELFAKWSPVLSYFWGEGNDGSYANPYIITTTAGLDLLATLVNGGNDFRGKYFRLGANIEYDSDVVNNFTPIGGYINGTDKYFNGNFNGQGSDGTQYEISGININKPDDRYIGLFGASYNNATIDNIVLRDATITGNSFVGGIVGNNFGYLYNCRVFNTSITANSQVASGIICGASFNDSRLNNNYYYNCSAKTGSNTAQTANIGTGNHHDIDGAKSIHKLSLGNYVNTTTSPTLTYKGTDYYAVGTPITLSYSQTVSEGQILFFTVNGEVIDDDTFNMPADRVDASAAAVLEIDFAYYWGEGNDGSEGHPYVISTPAGLNVLSTMTKKGEHYSGKFFRLGADIDMSGVSFNGIGAGAGNSFSGTFDGGIYDSEGTLTGRHTISGISINRDETAGFFLSLGHYVYDDQAYISGTVRNLVLEGTVSGGSSSSVGRIGGLAGNVFQNSTVENCVSLLLVDPGYPIEYKGSLVGKNEGTVSGCYYLGMGGPGANVALNAVGNGNDAINCTPLYSVEATTEGDYPVTMSSMTSDGTIYGDRYHVAGTHVTMTLTAPEREGYALAGFKYQVYNENTYSYDDVNLTDNNDGTYTLTVPAMNVTIEANYSYNGLAGLAQDDQNRYLVTSMDDLRAVATAVDALGGCSGMTFLLANDIENAGAFSGIAVGTSNGFYGTFDGGGHTISGMTIESESDAYQVGFIGNLPGILQNLTLKDCTVTATYGEAGMLAGSCYNGYMYHCRVLGGTVTAPSASAIANTFSPTGYGDNLYTQTVTVVSDGATRNPGECGCSEGDRTSYDAAALVIALADNASNSTLIETWADGKDHNVMLLDRKLWKDGDWNTLCLPFGISDFDGTIFADADIRALSSASLDDGVLTLNFTTATGEGAVTSITAGQPYLVKWDGSEGQYVENPVFTDVTISSTAPATDVISTDQKVQFLGTYSPAAIDKDNKACLFLGAANTLYWPDTDNYKVGAFRAYFQVDLGYGLGVYHQKITNTGDGSGPVYGFVRAFVLNFGEDSEAQGITTTDYTDSTDKAGAWFDLQGRRVSESGIRNSGLKHGLYIHNGRKVVIK